MSTKLENSQQWRFTWESQSHIPTLRLFLFHSRTNPSLHCRNLRVDANLARSLVLVTWSDSYSDSDEVSITVPIPRVLIDSDSPVSFKALNDHIEVKLVLLLPVGHPLVSSFDSILAASLDEEVADSDSSISLSVYSDIQSLSHIGGVHFYCRNCEFNLTRNPLSEFVEMPSVNWREVADNWFDACCCSFGGISEKFVTRFANSYKCRKDICLLDFATVIVCKDDLVQCNFPEKLAELKHEEHSENDSIERLSRMHLESDLPEGCCDHHVSETSSPENRKRFQDVEILENQKPFLNGFLGKIFMVRSSNLSREVDWVDFLCPKCCSLLGAYPCANGTGPVDGGVRLFKCYISTTMLKNGSRDVFGKYTLERMFANQLLEIAKDELSYRTVISNLDTKIPVLQLVLINSNSWSCTGFCLSAQTDMKEVPKIELKPVIKVLFTECSGNTESEMRATEDRIKEGSVDEAFMLRRQIEDTIELLMSANKILPPSYSSLQGLSLSSMKM